MLYIKNKMQYAIQLKVENQGTIQEFVFDCKRIYRDTGNIATTGVTPISENDFKMLYSSVPAFKKLFDSGKLVKTKESGATQVANKIDALEKENEVLKKELEKQREDNAKAISEDVIKLQEENASMKAELEALKKAKKENKKETKKENIDKTETTKIDTADNF